MAILAMSTYTGSILIEAPKNAWGIQTFTCTTTTVFPGSLVTGTGETPPDVVVVGTANDITLGVALCKPGHDIDTAYAAGESIPVAMAKSGAAVWTWLKANEASVFAGTPVLSDAATGVFVIIGEGALYEHLGHIIEYSATDASDDRPVKVVLV